MRAPRGFAFQGIAVGMTLAMLLLAACSSDPGTPATPAETTDVQAPPDEAGTSTPSPEPLRRTTVEIYFPSTFGDGLVGKYSEIFETVTPGDQAKQIIADLIADPDNPEALRALPAGTRLRQAFVLENGDCYLDFSRDLLEGVGGGSMEEILTVYAIVDSVVLNVSTIRRVAILVEGEPIETLNGHMDLRRPLRANPALILAPVVVQQRTHDTGELVAAVSGN